MITQPIFKNFSDKTYELILFGMVILMYICGCVEADIYVPAFPQMIKYFGIGENEIQLVISINFLGVCLASLVAGPLADSFGRRIVILAGLFLLMISSIILVITDDYSALLFWRFIQGVATSVPMVCAGAMFIDKYNGDKASKLIGLINAVITAAMAAAPILGAYISEAFNWRANFIVVMLLAILAFLGFWLFIAESLDDKFKRKFNLNQIAKGYLTVFRSPSFICYVLIACAPFITILVYISNLSVIFVNHLGVSLEAYSYYQASTMGVFVVFSLSSSWIIAKKGVEFTHNLGGILSIIGAALLFIIALFDHTSAMLICLSMAIIAAGGSMLAGTFGMKALSLFPEMNGIAMAACTASRLFLISIFVILTEVFFDGTIIPVALIIMGYTMFTGCFYAWLMRFKKII